jgi:molybdopterin/thiamine biosynthesis adenylyltransferase
VSTTIALREEHWHEILAALDNEVETAGFLLAGSAASAEHITLLGRSLLWVPDEFYVGRTATSLVIESRGYVPAFGAAAVDVAVPVFVHTHPCTTSSPSPRDDGVDEALRGPALIRSRAPLFASLVIGGTSGRPTFTGRVYDEQGMVSDIDRLRVIGRRIRVLHSEGAADADVDAEIFDRQIRAFGEDGQRMLARLRVGVVGAGGTGSAVFEQLVRDGVRQLTVIDDDEVTKTNVTRIHESGVDDAGTPKIAIAAAAAARIGLDASVTAINGRITDPAVAAQLHHLDVVFGCTDDEGGRLVLSKLALTHLIPVFDMGFAVVPNEDGLIRALDGRVTTLLPGQACLLCRERITPDGLAAEDLDLEERRRRAGEGYVPGLGEADPSVGTFTTLIACYAVNELLDRLFGYSDGVGAAGATELLVRLADRRLNFNSRDPGLHWCGQSDHYGRGDASKL